MKRVVVASGHTELEMSEAGAEKFSADQEQLAKRRKNVRATMTPEQRLTATTGLSVAELKTILGI